MAAVESKCSLHHSRGRELSASQRAERSQTCRTLSGRDQPRRGRQPVVISRRRGAAHSRPKLKKQCHSCAQLPQPQCKDVQEASLTGRAAGPFQKQEQQPGPQAEDRRRFRCGSRWGDLRTRQRLMQLRRLAQGLPCRVRPLLARRPGTERGRRRSHPAERTMQAACSCIDRRAMQLQFCG